MKARAANAIAFCFIVSTFTFGQTPQSQPPPSQPPAETVAPDIPGVVAAGTRVQLIKEGFQGTEGPISAPDGSLLFTETQASKITKIDKDGNITTFMENTNQSNGLAYDSKGRLISVQRGKPQIGVLAPAQTVLADKFEAQPFMSPNDLTVDKKGGVYFTDPGANPQPGQPPPGKPSVYYVKPDGAVIRITDDIERPNGILLSPDEKVLYVANTNGEFVIAYDVQPDGSVRNRRNFGKLEGVTKSETGMRSGADGLAVDSAGRLYVASTAGVQVFTPQGQHLGTIPIPRAPQNIAFAGADKKTLYVVGRGAAYKIAMQAQGFKERAK